VFESAVDFLARPRSGAPLRRAEARARRGRARRFIGLKRLKRLKRLKEFKVERVKGKVAEAGAMLNAE